MEFKSTRSLHQEALPEQERDLDDDDFRLGLNTEQTTLSAITELTKAKLNAK